ncbi:hypothetical protein PVBG_06072 [Plasmodium vivax Brazil I]|uniref:Variable surface protein Vir18 n=1 Tax=Plasmodium vivax (strain Brazil I) TaxID=1033975 RepID=A0A0J9T0I0_PLAV1|nr:hypothetical protein PVBG_06072 [Plasmodium vivax Brazil I]
MQRQSRPFNYISNAIRAFEERKCISEYSELKLEIEKEIDVFNKRTHKNFYQQWDKINKNITGKNNKIKNCVNKGYVSNDLYAVDTIKSFRERCLNRSAPTCSNSSPSQVRKSPELKRFDAGDSCKPGKNCKGGIAQSKEERGKSQSRALEEGSKTIGTPRTDPKHERQSNPIGQEPVNAKIISQPPPSVAHSDSHVVPEVKEPEQRDNGDSSLSNREEAQAQPLPILEHSKEKKFETSPRDQQLQNVITEKPGTGDSSHVRDSDEYAPKGKLPVGANSNLQQDNVEQVLYREGSNENPPPNYDTVSGVEISPPGGNPVNRRVTAETISGVVPTSNSADPDGKSHMDDDSANRPVDSEVSPVKTACAEASSDQASGSETSCSKREYSELNTSTGNILERVHEFFNKLPNKEHVIKASAPMGIVLLLGLLFKFTPLWRVLTKKNRKKGAVINEELNSVLQEPSIIDDERSIPFSYGAFEYSSFDQNSY